MFVFSEGAAELPVVLENLSVGLYPVSAGKKSHDLELRQEGIKGINVLLALSFLYRLHYASQCIISNAECLYARGRGGG